MRKFLFILSIFFAQYVNGQPTHISNLGGSTPNSLFVFNNKLYFSSSFANNGNEELWVYDNSLPISTINPKMLIDLDSSTSSGTYPRLYTEYNGKLFFKNNNAVYSYIDTLPISSTNPRYICPAAGGLTVYAGKLYFEIASIPPRTIWVFDDSLPVSITNPKILVNQILNPIKTTNYFRPFVYQGKMYFSATDDSDTGEELWVYDSSISTSASNPFILANINTNTNVNPNYNGSKPSDFIFYKNKMYFSADDGTGNELWVYNNSTNPQKVFDIDPNPYGGLALNKAVYSDTLFFAGHNNQYGTELWCYDGSNNPTLVTDINNGSNYSSPSDLKVFGNRLVLNADNGTNGRELFCFNNAQVVSPSNPFMIYDLYPGSSGGIMSTTFTSPDYSYEQYGKLLYFAGYGNYNIAGLWALTLCDIGAAPFPSFDLGNDTTIRISDTIVLTGPLQMTSYNWSTGSNNNQITFIADSTNIGSNHILLTVLDSNGCSFTDSINITVTAPNSIIAPLNNVISFSIFPNPTSDRFNILSTESIDEISVTNSLGQTIYHDMPYKKKISLRINDEGIYFVILTSNRQTSTYKLIVLH